MKQRTRPHRHYCWRVVGWDRRWAENPRCEVLNRDKIEHSEILSASYALSWIWDLLIVNVHGSRAVRIMLAHVVEIHILSPDDYLWCNFRGYF